MLRRATKQAEKRGREANCDERPLVCFASNDKGIAKIINDLRNPYVSAWEARTLPLSYARSLSRILRWPRSQVNHQWSLVNRAEETAAALASAFYH